MYDTVCSFVSGYILSKTKLFTNQNATGVYMVLKYFIKSDKTEIGL
jgi:hypothetical protein